MKYIKDYFNSHKKILLIIFLIIMLFVVASFLLTSYATNILIVHEGDDEYSINLTDDDNSLYVPSHSSIVVYYKITNTNKGTVQYGIGYTTVEYDPTDIEDTSLGVYVKGYDDDITGLIGEDETKFIKLKIFNQTDSDDTVYLSTILGYETGGELILDDAFLVDDIISSTNSTIVYDSDDVEDENSLFLNTQIERKSIASITIVDYNIVPEEITDYIDISENEDRSVLLWWKENSDNDSLVDVYIGSDYGTVIAPENSKKMFSYLTNANNINLSNFDTSNVTNIEGMFYNCTSLSTLDLSSFNFDDIASNSVAYNNMFINVTSNIIVSDSSQKTAFENLFTEYDSDKIIIAS